MAECRVTRSNTILPGQQRHPRRMALRRIIKLRKPQAIRCQFVQVRCLDFTAITTDVRVSKVIDHDHHHVRPVGRKVRSSKTEKQENCVEG